MSGEDAASRRRSTQPTTRSAPAQLGRNGRLVVLGVWTFLGLLETTNAYVGAQLRGYPSDWSTAFIGNMPWWYLWAALTPVALFLARRFRFDGGHAVRSVAVHLGAAALLTLVHLSITGALYWFTNTRGSPQMPSMLWQIRGLLQNYVMLDLVTYGGIVGAVFAVDFYRRFREEALTTTRLELRAAQLESTMNQARLDALRMELNPHFLFNTLNAISGLVRRSENDAAVSMLARLGDLLRITLERDSAQEVPLETELEVLHSYLEIERIRFHDRLVVDVAVQPEALPALVPTLILQPLVENAVRHGIAPVPGPGRVSIAAQRTNGNLVIEVRDTGPGFIESAGTSRRGVGLTNTASRLQQLYGKDAHLDVGTNPGGGASVSMTLPFRTGSEEGESDVDT
jgi:two-component system, LytTR family, sensor kinase